MNRSACLSSDVHLGLVHAVLRAAVKTGRRPTQLVDDAVRALHAEQCDARPTLENPRQLSLMDAERSFSLTSG